MNPQSSWTLIAALIWMLSIYIPCHAAADEAGDAPARRPPAYQTACLEAFTRLGTAIDSAGIRDIQDRRIPDFPHYRINRFLASFAGDISNDQAVKEWLERLLELGNQGRRAELANLPRHALPDLPPAFASEDLNAAMKRCAARLMAEDLENPDHIQRIRDNAHVPNDYSSTIRKVGVNPVSRWIVRGEIRDLNEQARHDFQRPEAIGGSKILSYVPNHPRPVLDNRKRAAILEEARSRSALGIPEPEPQALEQLFHYFAPVLRIGTNDDSDRIGRPFWQDEDRIGVDTDDPVVYRYHSFTRIQDHALLQLNYLIWFSERPSQGVIDIYSGRLDGLIWRVTLDLHGGVLLYDSVHPCGCYHKYYPVSPHLQTLEAPSTPEPPLILSKNIPTSEKGRLVIHVSSMEHYVIGLSTAKEQPEDGVAYRFEDYAALRSLPYEEGHRSMFNPDGLVIGTERGERWLTWPMGVRSAGTMRQKGHYPLSLIGALHFDDARLFENVFGYHK